ncbi:Gfo/Idh/MocA family protein [Paraferrimonas sedimenticola]|uniref:Oxidoreductase n=1 Tax=Paraferrimonas sedimenticola TaxID=375674 RepID=A0AA37RWL3_9GAMM|nr:Gfo/Idh/MocA family oxidoreductase [Paraferrimonas sedimenticola]GLP96741.1 oxidoreductase [Paraferrimonas sedimenticola]
MNKANKEVRVGIVGVGAMGKNHVRVATSHPMTQCVGVFDPNEVAGREIARLHRCQYFSDYATMLDAVDAVIIASPTSTHFEMGMAALEKGVHCLIEKPIAVDVEEATKLYQTAREKELTLAVGHVERYNPVFPELMKILESETLLSVNVNRLSFNLSRANDVDVVLDLMIHDLDVVNQMLGGKVAVTGAAGNAFRGHTSDYVTALLRGQSGAIAQITASKISQTKHRMMTISCVDSFIRVDFLRKEIEITRHHVGKYISDKDNVRFKHEALVERVWVPNVEPLFAELSDFAESILENRVPKVCGYAGIEALSLAKGVQEKCLAS